jgi:single-strand DNA-binding protein
LQNYDQKGGLNQMINQVALTGRLTRDVDLRYTQSGTAVGQFNLAVSRQFTNQAGERESDFINCVIWRKSAENFSNFTRKGSLVGIEGRLQTRTYDDKNGQRVYVTEVVVENFALLESKETTQARPREQGGQRPAPRPQQGNYGGGQRNGTRGQQQGYGSDPFAGKGGSIDISDDDPPF